MDKTSPTVHLVILQIGSCLKQVENNVGNL